MECMECFNKDANKKKGQVQYIVGRDNQIATSAKLLDITLSLMDSVVIYRCNRDN